MTRWFLTLLVGGSLALSGCSLALSGPSPERPRMKAPQCDTSKALVFVDALVASTLGIVAVSVGSNNGSEAILPLVGAGVFVASAIHGNNVVNECNREIGNYNSELASATPDPDAEPREAIVAPRQPGMAPPAVAMQPTLAAQSQPAPLPMQAPQPPPPPQPAPSPPQSQSQPQPQPQPQPASSEPWAAFWKEAP